MKKSDDEALVEVILFNLDEKIFAVEVSFVEEILHETPVSPLPFVPAYVDGLVNINSVIMPQVDLAVFLLQKPSSLSSTTKTIFVINIDGVLIALKIDSVRESFLLNTKDLVLDDKPSASISKSKAKHQISNNTSTKSSAEFFYHKTEKVNFFDARHLKDVVKSSAKPSGKKGFLGTVKEEKSHQAVYKDYLIASVNAQEYAIDLDEVVEIIILERLQELPRADSLVAGISLIRGVPRLMIHFAELMGERVKSYVGLGTAIMIKVDKNIVGVVADAMVGLESILEANIRQNNDQSQLTVLREDGKTLTKVFSLKKSMNAGTVAKLRTYLPNNKDEQALVKIPEVELLRFMFGSDAYAFPLDRIRRIVTRKQIEPLLTPQAYIMGNMEVEGRVVPVINLIEQLGYSQSEVSLLEFIIISDGSRDWAVAIGETDKIIKVPETLLDWVPKETVSFVVAYCHQDDDLTTILNIDTICKENIAHARVV